MQVSKGNDSAWLTFDLQDQADGANLVSVLHLHGVVPAVLLLGSDQGQHAQVAARDNKEITERSGTSLAGLLMTGTAQSRACHYLEPRPSWTPHLVSLSCRRLVEISAVTSLSGTPSFSQVTRALGKEPT